MAKNYVNKNRKRKALIAMLCALSVTCTGLAAACAPTEEEEPSTAVTAKEDTQLLKNGDFEHFDIPDKAVHLIKNVNSWTLGGDSSVKSGIIGTSADDWNNLTASDLADKLDYNNDLSSDNEEYTNYNSMRSRDILYKDTYAATIESDKIADSWMSKFEGGYQGYLGIEGDDQNGYTWNGQEAKLIDGDFYVKDGNGDFTKLIRKEQIKNPGTHWGDFSYENGEDKFGDKKAYKDDKGNYYLDEKKEQPVGNVLMVHNAATNTNNNGLHQYYTSSSITLEAQTSAEISLWVKTSDLKFDKGYAADASEQDKGAYIEVVQSVASTEIDAFKIKAINTEKIIAGAAAGSTTIEESNGWLKYTVYVNACDFANSTVSLRLGLGNSENNEKVTGYAFFDDVQVTKYRDLEATGTNCTYKDHKTEIETKGTSCTLASEENDKIFYADSEVGGAERHAYDFHYLIDLASEKGAGNNYSAIAFGNSNVEVGLTTEKDSKGVEYAAALTSGAKITDVGTKTQSGLTLPKDLDARPTNGDVITAFGSDKTFSASDFSGSDFSTLLNNITGDKGAHNLPAKDGGNTLVLFSAWGAPYTATISDNTNFSLNKDEYRLVSFWVKTSDMDGDTAATVKIYELDENGLIDEDSVQSLTIDTTDKTTDFENEKDIYNGWVQCFFFVKNETTDNTAKEFKIDFSFGTTTIAADSNYESGYAAIANLQTLSINEEIYKLASAGSNTALFSFTKETEKDGGTAFDEATGNYDINEGIAVPNTYKGLNGANVLGSITGTSDKLTAGLINRDVFNDTTSSMTVDEKNAVLGSFVSGATSWDDVFGKNCYQPLIIVNSLREYASKADANATNFTNYYTKNDDGTYTQVAQGATYDENETYYSLNKVANYGYYGANKTVSANGREVISVRVKVTGDAVAYIYLVDSDDTENLLSFTTPSYTFWYDEEGNVLDEELDEDWTTSDHRTHIMYTLRDDGLYDGNDGKLYGNLYNLIKSYKDSKYEHNSFYDKAGNAVSYDDLKDGETYYKTSAGESGEKANHYLCATDGTHVYEYIDGKYYYVEINKTDDKTTETTNLELEVNNFDEKYARYSNPDIDEELFVTVNANDCTTLGDEDGWVTVNFVVTAGSEEKHYRLELWSGARNETGVSGSAGSETYAQGAVAFDYSHGTVSENRLAAYEKEIINAYNRAFIAATDELNQGVTDESKKVNLLAGFDSGTKVNIASYEDLLKTLTTDQQNAVKAKMTEYGYGENSYKASYYTYTLYDSEAYVPFNANTAVDGETGYNYDSSSFKEQLAYLKFDDTSRNEKNIFVDYTTVDQSITKNTVTDDEETEEEETANSTELGLYISSIVLVVVLLVTLISILVTQYIRKRRKAKGAKNSGKNVYRKRDRYVKKLHLVKDEIVEPENGEAPSEEPTPAENEATEAPAEQPAEETTENSENPDGEEKE